LSRTYGWYHKEEEKTGRSKVNAVHAVASGIGRKTAIKPDVRRDQLAKINAQFDR